MTGLAQLSYASQSTALPEALEHDLSSILDEARRHNQSHQITGVLYFGQGYFFQHIEGSEADIEALYQQLLRDPRHQNLQVLARGPLAQRQFAGWSMKYVALNPALQDWLVQQNWPHFNPYQLQGDGLAPFLLNLQHMHGILPASASTLSAPPQQSLALQPLQPRERWTGMLATLILALMLVLAFFWVRQHG